MRLLFLPLLLWCASGFCGEIHYAATAIPEALLKNANAVKRADEETLEITADNQMILHRKYALTILNEKGSEEAPLVIGYDKFISIRSFEGTLYDATGRQLKKLKDKDIQDLSAVQDISLFDDNRMKAHTFYYNVYPYTVEYEVEIKYDNNYFLKPWVPQSDEHLAIEKSTFSLITPEAYNVRYKAFNYTGEPSVTSEKGKKIRTWQVSNLAPIVKPYASPKWNELTTTIYFAPSDFQMQHFKGNASTWEDLGKFALALNEGRDKLPDNIVQTIQQLTAGITDEREKIKVLYQYMQKNTRYISIQLGIGGLQPFEASFVAQKGYGDCKALSNYMYSLLKAVGIKSYYTLAHAGTSMDDKYIMEDFPSDQFNHIILCVPVQKDTMWLECTSQTDPAGYMGSFTGNRKVLLITENGGKLVSTPRYGINENLQLRSINAVVNEEGNMEAKINTLYTGLQQDDLDGMLQALSKDKVKKILNEELNFSTYDVVDFKYDAKKEALPKVSEQLDLDVSGYATITGKRLFITPNFLNRSSVRLTDVDTRHYDYQFDMAYKDVDTVHIKIPEGYSIESAPKDVSLKTKFGTYSTSVKFANNEVEYIRTREQFSGKYDAKEGAEIAKFFDTIYSNDRNKIVLIKKAE